MSENAVRLCLEAGVKRVFASALDWPGWSRSGRSEAEAIERLLEYDARYGKVVARAGLVLPKGRSVSVVEHLAGGAATDFGAPTARAADDSRPTGAADGERLASIVAACWAAFDEIAAAAPESLKKGPRGGGRDRTAVVAHVAESERHYARTIGVRHKAFAFHDASARERLRADILSVLRRPSDGTPVIATGWPVRFAARYIAWHVLDHAWEIEDRSA